MTTRDDHAPGRHRCRQLLGGLSAGLAAWLVGALPWIADGARLPISSAWPAVVPTGEVRVALPFGEYHLISILVAALVGGAVALPVCHVVSRRTAPHGVGLLGATLGFSVALGHTLVVVLPLVAERHEAWLLVAALVLLGVAGGVLGMVAGVGLVRRTSWWSPLGGGLLASALTSWVVALVSGPGPDLAGWQVWVTVRAPWLAGILLAGALLWAGWRPTTRLLWWPPVLALLWAWPAVTAALFYAGSYARSGMASGAGRAELADATRDVFVQALLPGNHAVAPYVVGLVAATVVAGGASIRASASGSGRNSDSEPVDR